MRRKKPKSTGSRISPAVLKVERERSSKSKPGTSGFDEPKALPAAPVVAAEDAEPSLTADLIAARRRDDLPAVVDLAARLRQLFPDAEPGYQMGATALRESGELEQAATVLAAARTQFDGKFWLLSELVLLAQNSGDWQGAVAAARALRERFPKHYLGWRIGLGALQKLGRVEEADQLLDQALDEFPEQEWPAVEALNRAFRGGQMQDAARFGEALRRVGPGNPFGWKASINALRNLGRLAEADELTKQAAEKFPGEEWVLSAAVSLAARQGDWQEACERAAALRIAFPANEEGWIFGLRALRGTQRFEEAAALLKEAEMSQPDKAWLLTESAHLLQATDQLSEALQQWQRVREALPSRHEGYIGGLQVSIGLGRLDEAEALLREATEIFPQMPWLFSFHAELAQQRGDHEEAARRWTKMLEEYPDNDQARRGIYKAKRHLGELSEADYMLQNALVHAPESRWALNEAAMLAEARYDFAEADRRWSRAAAVLPDDAQIALKHALVLSLDQDEQSRDWPTTMERLRMLHERHPKFVEGWRSHLYALRVQGLSADAEQLAADCLSRMPDEPELWLQYAFAAADQDAPELAAERLREAAGRFPKSLKTQNAFAEALARLGNLDEADRQYRQGLEQFSNSADLACGYAAIAASRQDWTEALRRWTLARERFPKERRIAQGLLDAHAALGEGQVVAPPPLQTGDAEAQQPERTKLFWQFESLGGTGQGCEFGIVQRIAGGAEPLGLLRWSAVAPEKLVEALKVRFEGVGTPTQTFIDFYATNDPSNPEYRCRDTRFETVMHTFVFKKDMPQEKMFAQTCRRMTFLRRKLIQDLEEGSKIFVYKIFQRNLTDEELAELHLAMRSYGNNTLLYVRYADDRNPSGTVVKRDNGLFIGYISGFSMTFPEGRPRTPDLPAWTSICKTALALHLGEGQKNKFEPELHQAIGEIA